MDTLMIVLGLLLGVVLLFGIYKLATAHLNERSTLKPSSETAPRQTAKAILTIIISILLFIGFLAAYHYFTTR